MIIDKLKPGEGKDVLQGLPAGYIDGLKKDVPPHLYKVLADVITLLLKRINVPEEEISEVTGKIYERRIQEMFPHFDNYDVQETRKTARAEGKAEGKAEGETTKALAIARKLLKMAMPIEDIIHATGLPSEEVEKLREEIISSKTVQ